MPASMWIVDAYGTPVKGIAVTLYKTVEAVPTELVGVSITDSSGKASWAVTEDGVYSASFVVYLRSVEIVTHGYNMDMIVENGENTNENTMLYLDETIDQMATDQTPDGNDNTWLYVGLGLGLLAVAGYFLLKK